jgi:ribonuclease E
MLIDATHPEETRVVVLRNGRVEEFDYESAARKLLRGNIYLAKVTRVEPSLQAAFVDYGGNRHGFLAFNEIHPDYYQIPVADRLALLEEEAAQEAAEEAAIEARAAARAAREARRAERAAASASATGEADDDHGDDDRNHDSVEDAGNDDDSDNDRARTLAESSFAPDEILSEPAAPETIGGFEPPGEIDDDAPAEDNGEAIEASASDEPAQEAAHPADDQAPDAQGDEAHDNDAASANGAAESVDHVGSEDALEELPRPRRRARSYKIQEVIKRRQVILVQVVKEERGNKGAALTTYLSLAGRYTVLMPNTARGGGISRKITNPQDRKRLKAIAQELEVPEGMGLIIRTAGASRTKQEIKRDFEYLLRLWESVRDLTLASTAPNLVYEEGNLIKRSIRDLYNKDVEEIIVAGDEAHGDAHDFMRMLMPSHAKNVIEYTEPEPLFTRYRIEPQLNAMFSPYVTLKSGGYLVINQTEALVAIDINSGKSTREFSIEETALNTNLEAADEIARQLKLRDLAGLIVIDFIDMEEKRNNRAVERRMKEALRFDRARIQVGRISHFGLLEMSRQRLRTGVLEGSTSQCPHCQGTGIIRSTESVALAVLRGLEDAIVTNARTSLIATTTPTVALYILNNKRAYIADMEARSGLPIIVQGNDKLAGANFTIERAQSPAQSTHRRSERVAVNMNWGFESDDDEAPSRGEGDLVEVDGDDESGEVRAERNGSQGDDGKRKRRRRRRGGRRGERRENGVAEARHSEAYDTAGEDYIDSDDAEPSPRPRPEGDVDDASEEARAGSGIDDREAEGGQEERRERRGRRRGRRGGRRGRERNRERASQPGTAANGSAQSSEDAEAYDEPTGDDRPASSAPDLGSEPQVRSEPEQAAAEPPSTREDFEPAFKRPEIAEPATVARTTESFEAEPEPATASAKAKPAPAPAAAAPSPSPARARSRSTASSEPRLERVVVSPDREAEPAADVDTSSEPVRKGWWQRRFSAE